MIHDVAIIGAGVAGLTLARAFAAQNKSVLLLEQGEVGDGASGGLLGALMPARPMAKGPLPRLQRHALSRYEDDIAELEQQTNLSTGYRRAGRLQPLPDNYKAQLAQGPHLEFLPRLEERFPALVNAMAPQPNGYLYDAASAQIMPALLLAALKADVSNKITLHEQTRVARVVPGATVTLETDSNMFHARRAIVTAGWQSAGLIDAPVTGVKGHALAIDPALTDMPLIFGSETYIVFHDTLTALGSTTEKEWHDPQMDEAQIALVQHRVAKLLPMAATAPVRKRWVGIRPRGPHALPYIQQTAENVLTVTGFYKIGLALGFAVARLVADENAPQGSTEDFWNWADQTQNLGLFSYT